MEQHINPGIVGAGAMGSIFAYFFHRAGIEPVIFEHSADVVDSITSGLNVREGDQHIRFSVEISHNPEILHSCSAVYLFVKSYSTSRAMEEIAPHLHSDSIVVTLQNGIGNREVIAGFIPEERIVYGSTIIGASKTSTNTVSFGGSDEVAIGGTSIEAVQFIAKNLREAGLSVQISDKPDEVIWKKAIINAGINPIGALLGIPNGRILENEFTRSIQEAIVREAAAVARAHGLGLDPMSLLDATRDVCIKTAVNLCSMLQDINAGRKTEIDSINGSIIRYGEKYSITVPVNRTMAELIKAKELLR